MSKIIATVLFIVTISYATAFAQRISIPDGASPNVEEQKYKALKKASDFIADVLPDSSEHFFILKSRLNKKLFVFVARGDKAPFKKSRTISLFQISKDAGDHFGFNEAMFKKHSDLIKQSIIDYINRNDYFKPEFDKALLIYYSTITGSAKTYYQGIYLRNKIDSSQSRIIELTKAEPPTQDTMRYQRPDIKYTPAGYTIEYKTPPAKPKKAIANDYTFNHSCDGGFNFTVTLTSDKNDGYVYIHNNIPASVLAASSKNDDEDKDTAEGKKDKDSAAPAGAKNDKPVRSGDTVVESVKLVEESAASPVPDTAFQYNVKAGFEPALFRQWLKNRYKKIGEDCATLFTYRISQELKAQDAKSDNAKPAAAAPVPPTAAAKPKLIKDGNISIVSAKSFTMTARYDKKKVYNDNIRMRFRVSGAYDSTANQLLLINKDSILTNNPSVGPLTINKGTWNDAIANNDGYLDMVVTLKSSSIKDTLKDQVSGLMIISGQTGTDAGSKEIILKPGIYQKDMPYWMEVGSNFDLLNFKPNNLYAGILAFEKDITNVDIFGLHLPLSITGGVYESQSTSSRALSDSGFIYRDGTSYGKIPGRGYPYYRDTGTVSSKTTVQSMGLFFSPHFLLNSVPSKSNGFHIYGSIYAEMLWQQISTSFDYSKTNRNSTMYESDSSKIFRHNFKENSVSLDYRSHYFGFGIPIYLKSDAYSFYLNPVFGWTSQKFAFLQNDFPQFSKTLDQDYRLNKNMDPNPLLGFATPKTIWNTFYIAQFRLTSEQYGVSVTGEVRGFFLHNSKPLISLSVSKKFDVGKVIGDLFGK